MLIAHHRHFSGDISAIECHGDIFPFIIPEQEKWTTGVSHQITVSWNVMDRPPIFMLVLLLIIFFSNLQWVKAVDGIKKSVLLSFALWTVKLRFVHQTSRTTDAESPGVHDFCKFE